MIDSVSGTKQPSTSILVALVAFGMVLAVFVADWIVPSIVSVGLAYQAAIVFAGFKGTRKLTIQVIMLGVAGIAIGWFLDYAADSYHFREERIENRLISLVSLAIVGSLTLMLPRNLEHPTRT